MTIVGVGVGAGYGRPGSAIDPAPPDGLLLLEGREDLVTIADVDRVAEWTGQRGGVNAETSSVPTRPKWLPTGGPNGQPAVWFETTFFRMRIPALNPLLTDCHVIAALDVVSNIFQSCIVRQDFPFVCTSANRTDMAFVGGHDGTAWRNVAPATTGPQLLEWIWRAGAGTLEVLRDGASLGTAPYDGTLNLSLSTSLAVGADIKLSWLGLWDRVLSDAEAAALRGYLLDRYR